LSLFSLEADGVIVHIEHWEELLQEDVADNDGIRWALCLAIFSIRVLDAINTVSKVLDNVVVASEGVVDAVECERDVWQLVDVRAVLVDDDIIKNWIH